MGRPSAPHIPSYVSVGELREKVGPAFSPYTAKYKGYLVRKGDYLYVASGKLKEIKSIYRKRGRKTEGTRSATSGAFVKKGYFERQLEKIRKQIGKYGETAKKSSYADLITQDELKKEMESFRKWIKAREKRATRKASVSIIPATRRYIQEEMSGRYKKIMTALEGDFELEISKLRKKIGNGKMKQTTAAYNSNFVTKKQLRSFRKGMRLDTKRMVKASKISPATRKYIKQQMMRQYDLLISAVEKEVHGDGKKPSMERLEGMMKELDMKLSEMTNLGSYIDESRGKIKNELGDLTRLKNEASGILAKARQEFAKISSNESENERLLAKMAALGKKIEDALEDLTYEKKSLRIAGKELRDFLEKANREKAGQIGKEGSAVLGAEREALVGMGKYEGDFSKIGEDGYHWAKPAAQYIERSVPDDDLPRFEDSACLMLGKGPGNDKYEMLVGVANVLKILDRLKETWLKNQFVYVYSEMAALGNNGIELYKKMFEFHGIDVEDMKGVELKVYREKIKSLTTELETAVKDHQNWKLKTPKGIVEGVEPDTENGTPPSEKVADI